MTPLELPYSTKEGHRLLATLHIRASSVVTWDSRVVTAWDKQVTPLDQQIAEG